MRRRRTLVTEARFEPTRHAAVQLHAAYAILAPEVRVVVRDELNPDSRHGGDIEVHKRSDLRPSLLRTQAQQATIDSQLAALLTRARADGFTPTQADIYSDEGVSGTILIRPALERLRDRVADGEVDRIYVHSPDRLARKYAYQVLLLDEFKRLGVETIFLHGPTGNTPEDELLVQVQGMIAEYERTRLLERCRRGKLHKARAGSVAVLARPPYGYRYIRAGDGAPAQFVIDMEKAAVVRQIFEWVVNEPASLNQVARRLDARGIATPAAAPRWGLSTIHAILGNSAYMGAAKFQRTEMYERPTTRRPTRSQRGKPKIGRKSVRVRPPEDHISIPVPAVVSELTFLAAADQLQRNRELALRNAPKAAFLLGGLTVCGARGYAFIGRTARSQLKNGNISLLRYYFCCAPKGRDVKTCRNPTLRAELLEDQVWASVRGVLEDPARTLDEWGRRTEADGAIPDLRAQQQVAQQVVVTAERAIQRLGDAYEAGVIELPEYSERRGRLRGRLDQAKADLLVVTKRLQQTIELTEVVATVEGFPERLHHGLGDASWDQKRQVIRAIVERVEVGAERVRVVYRVPTSSRPRPPGDDADAEDRSCRLLPGRIVPMNPKAGLGAAGRVRTRQVLPC
jgi:site-specific DNA recombinase